MSKTCLALQNQLGPSGHSSCPSPNRVQTNGLRPNLSRQVVTLKFSSLNLAIFLLQATKIFRKIIKY